MYATFGDDRLRGLVVARGRISHFPIDLCCRPYNTLALPCKCVWLGLLLLCFTLIMLLYVMSLSCSYLVVSTCQVIG